jgi:formylglycine-generating enzyme required for sulfatase activity
MGIRKGTNEKHMNPGNKILILAANPKTTPRLRLDEEVREIAEGLQRARYRSQFRIHSRLAIRLRDLRRALLDHKPKIVHFTGHGQKDGLLVEDEIGSAVRIATESLAGLFELFSDQVKCVILSTCYSAPQAAAISKHIDYVIGMKKEISDEAAIEFSVGFYDALGAGKSVEDSFKFGCNAIHNLPEHLIPILLKKKKGSKKHKNNDIETGTLIDSRENEKKSTGGNEEKTTPSPKPVPPNGGINVTKVIINISIALTVLMVFVFILKLLSPPPPPAHPLPIEMVRIPSGNFCRGTSKDEIDKLVKEHSNWKTELFKDEKPQREIYLDSFYISKYEITNAQYKTFLEDKPNYEKPAYWNTEGFNDPDQPVVGVSWYDADAFCNWLSEKTGENYRLPTEAEWEKAARGTDGRFFPWGNEEPDISKANFMEQHHKTIPVKEKPLGASAFKLMHMAGNVAEWCSDWYDESYYRIADERDPNGPSNGARKVVRGGAWNDNAFFLRCADRNSYPPKVKKEIIGFRIVRITAN